MTEPEYIAIPPGPWFQADQVTDALDLYDSVKDEIAGRAPTPDHDAGAAILRAFALAEGMGLFAGSFARDQAALVREHGGNDYFVGQTLVLDGIMLGIALLVVALDDEPDPIKALRARAQRERGTG